MFDCPGACTFQTLSIHHLSAHLAALNYLLKVAQSYRQVKGGATRLGRLFETRQHPVPHLVQVFTVRTSFIRLHAFNRMQHHIGDGC